MRVAGAVERHPWSGGPARRPAHELIYESRSIFVRIARSIEHAAAERVEHRLRLPPSVLVAAEAPLGKPSDPPVRHATRVYGMSSFAAASLPMP
jgi:hypothetical protein